MREAAMSSIAFVIFFVDCTDLIRRRYSRSWAPIYSALLFLRLGALVRGDGLLALFAGLHRLDLFVLDQRLAGGRVEGLLEVADRLFERGDSVVGELPAGH